jgi:EmrB/QacA subfamily drug resistance transporter
MVSATTDAVPAAAADQAADQGHPRKWWILVAVSVGMFMALLDVTIVNIAIPAIIGDLHTTVTHVSWVLNAYSLVLAACFLSMGRIGDKYGQKRVFIFGLVTFTVFSLLCGFAPNIDWLIAFRAGQGLGGAALLTISLAIVLGAFPKRQQGMAVGLWGALGTAAAAVGPTLGGLLVTYGSWHWIFFVNVPIGVLAVVFTALIIPAQVRTARSAGGIDVPGIVLSATGLLLLTLALVQGNSWGWGSPAIIALFVTAVACYPVFMWWEGRTTHPMFPLKLLRIRSFTAANSAIMFIGVAMGGTFLLVVIFMVSVLGYSELRAAIALTVMPLVALVVAPNAGRLADRIGPRLPAAAGAASFAVGLLLLAQLNGSATVQQIMWRIAFIGVGMGLAMPTLSAASMASLPPQVRGVGSGSLNTLRQVGFTLGVAVLVAIFTHTVAINAQTATRQAVGYVMAQPQIPAQAKGGIVAAIRSNAAQAAASGGGAAASRLRNNPLAGQPQAPAGSPEARGRQQMAAHIAAIYKDDIAKSFQWPFYAAAIAALLAIVPGLMTGRRLGEHEGHEELSRAERSALSEAGGGAAAPAAADSGSSGTSGSTAGAGATE